MPQKPPVRARALTTFESLGSEPLGRRDPQGAAGDRPDGRADRGRNAARPDTAGAQVALIVAQGATTKEAAVALFLSPKTIEFHLGNTYRKLGVSSRTELVRRIEHLDAAQTA